MEELDNDLSSGSGLMLGGEMVVLSWNLQDRCLVLNALQDASSEQFISKLEQI